MFRLASPFMITVPPYTLAVYPNSNRVELDVGVFQEHFGVNLSQLSGSSIAIATRPIGGCLENQ